MKNQFLKLIPGSGRQVEDRKNLARTTILSAFEGRGDTYLSMEKYDRALDTYQTGLDAAKQSGVEFHQSRFHLGVGVILHRRMDFAGALDNFQNALGIARRQERPDDISNAARRIGDVLRETGKKTEAPVFYREAIEQIESSRSLLLSQNDRQTYFGGWLGAYQGITETLRETAAHEQAFHYGERVRSRTFLETLGTKVQLNRRKDADALGFVELSDGDSEEAYRAFLDKVRKADPEQASLMTVEPLTLCQTRRWRYRQARRRAGSGFSVSKLCLYLAPLLLGAVHSGRGWGIV